MSNNNELVKYLGKESYTRIFDKDELVELYEKYRGNSSNEDIKTVIVGMSFLDESKTHTSISFLASLLSTLITKIDQSTSRKFQQGQTQLVEIINEIADDNKHDRYKIKCRTRQYIVGIEEVPLPYSFEIIEKYTKANEYPVIENSLGYETYNSYFNENNLEKLDKQLDNASTLESQFNALYKIANRKFIGNEEIALILLDEANMDMDEIWENAKKTIATAYDLLENYKYTQAKIEVEIKEYHVRISKKDIIKIGVPYLFTIKRLKGQSGWEELDY